MGISQAGETMTRTDRHVDEADRSPDLKLVLPYPISANRYWRMYRGRMLISAEARKYRTACAWAARIAGVREPTSRPVAIRLDLYPRRPMNWARRAKNDPANWADSVRCIDLGNAEKVLSDALNGVVWVDDSCHREIHKYKRAPDEHGARIELRVWML